MTDVVKSYDLWAEQFCRRTAFDDERKIRGSFSKYLEKNSFILDAGCGSGRDTKGFREEGYRVEPIDGSSAMVKFATQHTGDRVLCTLFEEMEYEECFDGIWACNSLVHHSPECLREVFPRFIRALKPNGYWFFSLRNGVGVHPSADSRVRFYLWDQLTLEEFLGYFPELELIVSQVVEGTIGEKRRLVDWRHTIVRKRSTVLS